MLMIDKIILLSKAEIFQSASDEALSQIAHAIKLRSYQAGEVIIEEGEMGDRLYIIVDGKVSVSRHSEHLTTFEHPAVFGDLAVLDDSPRVVTVTALEDSDMLELKKDDLKAILEINPEPYPGIVSFLCKRVRQFETLSQRKYTQNR